MFGLDVAGDGVPWAYDGLPATTEESGGVSFI
jgi:hypothetical protein